MPIISPKLGLGAQVVIELAFGFPMLLNPVFFLKQYKFEVADMEELDRMMVTTVMQNFGIVCLFVAGIMMVALRRGSAETQKNMSLLAFVGNALSGTAAYYSSPAWTALGVPLAGVQFNIGLFGTVALCNLLGAGLTFKMPNICKSVYLGTWVWCLILSFYAVCLFFFTEALVEGYGIHLGEKAYAFLITMLKYSWSVQYILIVLLLKAGCCTADFCFTWALNRALSIFAAGFFFCQCISTAWFVSFNKDGQLDKFVMGQNFNALLFFLIFLSSYVPTIMLDARIAVSVEKAIGGVETLL